MLAKASPAGKGFSGKIDYLYDGRLNERKGIEKQAQVIIHSDNLRIPTGADDKATRNLLKRDFMAQARLHKSYGKDGKNAYVGEHILSFTNEDKKVLTKEKIKDITTDYVALANIDKTQFIAISHKDTNNLHVHILFNRAMNNGKKYEAWKEQNKTVERGIALALKYDFKLVKNQLEVAQSKEVILLRSTMLDIQQLRESNSLLASARNLHHLEKICQNKGIEFTQDDLLKTVTIGQTTYQEANLKAVFLLNRQQSEKTIEPAKEQLLQKAQNRTHEVEHSKESELQLREPNKRQENDKLNKFKKNRKRKGHEIKIERIKSSEIKKDRGI